MQRYFNAKDAAQFIGMSTSTCAKWRMTGDGPPFIKPGKRRVLYARIDLENWLNKRRFQSTSQYEIQKDQ